MLSIEHFYMLLALFLLYAGWRNLRERRFAHGAFWTLLGETSDLPPDVRASRAQVGLGDRDGIAEALRACIADRTPPLPIQASSGPWLDQYRSEPGIDQALDRLYDGARPRV